MHYIFNFNQNAQSMARHRTISTIGAHVANSSKNNVALAHSYQEGKSCSKFGQIPPSGDSVTDGQTDGRTDGGVHNIPIAKAWERISTNVFCDCAN